MDRLGNIIKAFNDNFGTLFAYTDRIVRHIREGVVPRVVADQGYRNAKANTPRTAVMALDQAVGKAMQIYLKDDTPFYKQYVENDDVRRSLRDLVVQQLTGQPDADRHA